MSKHSLEHIRNIVLVGHGAVGKTSLADQMLFKAGIATRAGSVDDGTSAFDTDEEERARHFSIQSHMAHFERNGVRVNIIDTPGYPEFVGQVISAICAAETALITINATSGIEANTRKTFELSEKAGLARMIVINKCDQENINLDQLLEAIQETFGRKCVPLNLPVGLGSNFKGVASTLGDGKADGVIGDLPGTAQIILDAIVEADEELMVRYLEGEQLSIDEIKGGVTKAIAGGTLIPILFVSAKTGVGLTELMDAIVTYGLSPAHIPRHAQKPDGADIEVRPTEEEPLLAQVFKTRIDPFVAKMSFVRIYRGKLTKDSIVNLTRTGKGIKIHQLLDVQGGQHEPIDEAHAGDVVVIPKIEELHVGDTLSGNGDGFTFAPPTFPTPMIGLAVEPKSRADQQKISTALHKIEEEDPTFQVTRDTQTHELVMRGMSELHLQIVQDILHKRDKVDVITHQPKVPYRETCASNAEGSYRHKKQSGGSGQFAEVHLRIAPLPHGIVPEEYFTREQFPSLRSFHYDPLLNFAFIDCVTGGSVPNQYIPAVEKGVRDRMEQGVLAGYQVQDVAVSLFFGKDHPVDSNETAFKTAGSMCFREIFKQAKPVLLEPIVHLEITVPADKLGDITSDLNTRRGRIEGMDGAAGGLQMIRARAPLAEVMTYARSLSSITGGQGSFSMELSHYEQVPGNVQQQIVAAMQHKEEEA